MDQRRGEELAAPQRDRAIDIGARPEIGGDEILPRDGSEGGEDGWFVDPVDPQLAIDHGAAGAASSDHGAACAAAVCRRPFVEKRHARKPLSLPVPNVRLCCMDNTPAQSSAF